MDELKELMNVLLILCVAISVAFAFCVIMIISLRREIDYKINSLFELRHQNSQHNQKERVRLLEELIKLQKEVRKMQEKIN